MDTQEELHTFMIDELGAGDGDGDGDGSIAPDADLIKRGIVDSLGLQQILSFCESRYDIRIDEGDLVIDNFRTLEALAAFVERKRAEPAPSNGRLRLRSRRR